MQNSTHKYLPEQDQPANETGAESNHQQDASAARGCCRHSAQPDEQETHPVSIPSSRRATYAWIAATGVLASYIILAQFLTIEVRLRRSGAPQRTAAQATPAVSAAPQNAPSQDDAALIAKVLPNGGVELPARWGDLGKKLIESGVIDEAKLTALYAERGGLGPENEKLLKRTGNGNLTMTRENSPYLLNLLWAFGLGNKSSVLENGPMQDKQYGGADKFASTGGWTLAKGNAMDHYAKHRFVALTPAQERMVERVSQNIYRPCCGNSTYFPDCNHGMAMLGLLELMASQGADETAMYRASLAVNSFWFPDTYVTIAKYLGSQGTPWEQANPREILGANYSSGGGYRQIAAKVSPVQTQGGGGCGV